MITSSQKHEERIADTTWREWRALYPITSRNSYLARKCIFLRVDPKRAPWSQNDNRYPAALVIFLHVVRLPGQQHYPSLDTHGASLNLTTEMRYVPPPIFFGNRSVMVLASAIRDCIRSPEEGVSPVSLKHSKDPTLYVTPTTTRMCL